MARFKSPKKVIKIIAVVAGILMVANILLSGVNIVPFKYRNVPVSFLTPDLTWDSKPSDIILKYGLPEDIGEVNEIDGSREFNFNFKYDEKNVSLSADNGWALNNEFHRYSFIIDCKTPEEARKYFDECHEKIMVFYKNEPEFEFEGTETETDYEFKDGSPCSYASSYINGKEEILIMDDEGNEIPIEEADNVIQVKTKVNSYDMRNTVGVNWWLSYSDGDSSVYLHADIMY